MTVEELWERYAATWSLPDDRRDKQLAAVAAAGVTYSDPASEVAGLDALSRYMAGFQASVPGGAFSIRAVRHHHGRSLAHWSLIGPNEQVLQTGSSFALHADDGRLQAVTGFFDPASER
jgi:hypothetical protein